MKTINILLLQTTPYIDRDIFNICATIVIIALVMAFILSLVKKIMAHHLRKKIIEKGIPENIAQSILQSGQEDEKQVSIKWLAISMGLSIGLIFVYFTLPLGIHSLAILSFCITLSFLGYFLYLKNTKGN